MPALNPRNVHVLFVHGVGTHSRLSSLLQAYQALRANIRSPEAPTGDEDWNPEWKLREFDDGAGTPTTPHLKLALDATTPGATEAVYLYEVNYSALAGVVRANQPIDLTGLFVGFDLAVNVARKRLKENPVQPRPPGRYDIVDSELALTVQKLAGVFVAATVPILGIPSLVFSRFTRNIVARRTSRPSPWTGTGRGSSPLTSIEPSRASSNPGLSGTETRNTGATSW